MTDRIELVLGVAAILAAVVLLSRFGTGYLEIFLGFLLIGVGAWLFVRCFRRGRNQVSP